MIKCNVTVCGTVSRLAQMRANKEGKQFISFGVNVVVPSKSGVNKTIEVSVAKDSDNRAELLSYPFGSRVEVVGVLQFHKKGETLYLNLSASGVNTFNAAGQDCITGSMEFRGTIGKQVEVKTDKNNRPYTLFSAFSSEKDGDGFAYTWVRFMQFGKEKEEWIQPKTGINAKGDVVLGVYNDRLDISCRASEITLWEKNTPNANKQ